MFFTFQIHSWKLNTNVREWSLILILEQTLELRVIFRYGIGPLERFFASIEETEGTLLPLPYTDCIDPLDRPVRHGQTTTAWAGKDDRH